MSMLPVKADLCLIHLSISHRTLFIGGTENTWMVQRSTCQDASSRIVYFSLIINIMSKPETWKGVVALFYVDSVPFYKLFLLHLTWDALLFTPDAFANSWLPLPSRLAWSFTLPLRLLTWVQTIMVTLPKGHNAPTQIDNCQTIMKSLSLSIIKLLLSAWCMRGSVLCAVRNFKGSFGGKVEFKQGLQGCVLIKNEERKVKTKLHITWKFNSYSSRYWLCDLEKNTLWESVSSYVEWE